MLEDATSDTVVLDGTEAHFPHAIVVVSRKCCQGIVAGGIGPADGQLAISAAWREIHADDEVADLPLTESGAWLPPTSFET